MCVETVWGTVCNDFWGPNEVRVACRQLGFQVSGELYNPYYAGLVPLADQCLIQKRGLGDETYHFYAIHVRFCIYTILQ